MSGLTLCGYCELLTLNPPLTLSLDLALPWYAPTFFEPLPEKPLQPALRRETHRQVGHDEPVVGVQFQ